MIELNIEESKKVLGGGTNFSGAVINAIKSSISFFFEFGQIVGGAIRRISTKHLCEF